MLKLFLFLIGAGHLSLAFAAICSETNGEGNKKNLKEPCFFNQLIDVKQWNMKRFMDQTDRFFDFGVMRCSSYEVEGSGKMKLTCYHTKLFYIMKNIMSFGTTERTEFIFKFSPLTENDYKSTDVEISGKLSQALRNTFIRATKPEGFQDFSLSTSAVFPQIDMETFIDQRKPDGFKTLTNNDKLENFPPKVAVNAEMSGMFSALVTDTDKQAYEFLISFLGPMKEQQFYIFQSLTENINDELVIAFYKENPSNAGTTVRDIMDSLRGVKWRGNKANEFVVSKDFAPIFEVQSSAMSISDGEIVNINSEALRNIAIKYVSPSSEAFILEGALIYWHVDDSSSLKMSADQVPGVENPPTPTNETSTVPQENKIKRHTKPKTMKPLKREKHPATNKLTLNAHIIHQNKIEIRSPDYLKGTYEKQLSTFLPYHYFKHDSIKNTLYPVKMIFDKITIGFKRKELRLYCNITQKYDLVQNFIEGEGIAVYAKAKLTMRKDADGDSEEIRFKDIGMSGTIEVLQGLVNVNLQYAKDGTLYVVGLFDIANMTQFINATGMKHYLPENLRKTYPRLTNFAITRLKIKSKLNENVLRIIGRCLIFSEPKTDDNLEAEKRDGIEDESPASLLYESKLRVVLTNTSGDLKYSVGIIGEDIPLQVAMRELFNATITGTSWVKFKFFVMVMSNNNEINVAQAIDERLFNSFNSETGLQIKTVLLPPVEEDCKMSRKEKLDPLNKEALVKNEANGKETVEIHRSPFIVDYTCMFVKDQELLMENFEYATATVTPTSYEIKSLTQERFFDFQSDPVVSVGNFGYTIKSVKGWDSIFFIEGEFRFMVKNDRLIFKGLITFDDMKGKLVLQLKQLHSGRQNFGDAALINSGYSVIGKDDTFSKFHFDAFLYVGTVKTKLVNFRKNVEVIYDLRTDDIFMKGARNNNGNIGATNKKRNSLLELFDAFGTDASSHVLLKELHAISLTWLIYQQNEEVVKTKHGIRRIQPGLNFYGTLAGKGDRDLLFNMHYNKGMGALIADIELPNYKLPLRKDAKYHPFELQRSTKKQDLGGILFVKASTTFTSAQAQGYLRVVGLEYDVEFPIMADGQFHMDLPYSNEIAKLFNEAEVRYRVSQDIGVTDFNLVDPKIKIDLAPSLEKISRAIRHAIEAMIANVDEYLVNSGSFINFVTIVDGEISTMKEVINEIRRGMGKLQSTLKQLVQQISSDCAEQCKDSKVFIYGYDFQGGKFVGNEDAHDVANVTCIAECEMIKPVKNDERRSLLSSLKEALVQFKREKKRASIMQIMLDEHYNSLSKMNDAMHKNARAASLILSKTGNLKNPKISVASLVLENQISVINFKGAGSKCLSGFKMAFSYNDVVGETDIDLCFNGEFDQFAAYAFVLSYYGEDKYNQFGDLLDDAAELKQSLKTKTKIVTKLFKKIANARTTVELEEVQNEVEETILDYMGGLKKSQIPKHKIKAKKTKEAIGYITYGGKNVTLPGIDTEVLEALEIDQDYTIKNPKSKRVFMYSSPWAALNVLHLHQNKSMESLPMITSIDNAGYCKRLTRLSSVLNSVRGSLSSYAASYVNAKKNFENVETNMKSGLVELKKMHGSSIMHDDDKGNLQYWLTQYEKGVNRFSKLSNMKLHDHNNHGLARWKNEMDNSLQHSGLGSIENVIEMLKKRSSSKRSNIDHDRWIRNASLMGKEISNLMKNSNKMRMADAELTVRSMSQKFDNFFEALTKSCKASFKQF